MFPRDRVPSFVPPGVSVSEKKSVVPASPLSRTLSSKATGEVSALFVPVPVTLALDPEQLIDAIAVELKSVSESLYATFPFAGVVPWTLMLNLPPVVARVPLPVTLQPPNGVPPPPAPAPRRKSIAGVLSSGYIHD